MSQWTYVRGCMEVSCSPYENKFKEPIPYSLTKDLTEEEKVVWHNWRKKWLKGLYLPYPEEQFKITTPRMISRYHKPTKKDPSEIQWNLFVDDAFLYSLPRAKPILDEAFKLLPQGEVGFRYAVKQDCWDYSSTSFCGGGFETPCLAKYYKNALEKLYYNEGHWSQYSYEELVKYQKLDQGCSVVNVNAMTIGIVESLRYASAQEVEEGFEKFFTFLREHEFDIDNVLLEWNDNYEEGIYHRLDKGGQFDDLIIETIDSKTQKVLRRKTYYYPQDEDGIIDYDSPDYDRAHPLVKEEVFDDSDE